MTMGGPPPPVTTARVRDPAGATQPVGFTCLRRSRRPPTEVAQRWLALGNGHGTRVQWPGYGIESGMSKSGWACTAAGPFSSSS